LNWRRERGKMRNTTREEETDEEREDFLREES
jgi:hypothetical protein